MLEIETLEGIGLTTKEPPAPKSYLKCQFCQGPAHFDRREDDDEDHCMPTPIVCDGKCGPLTCIDCGCRLTWDASRKDQLFAALFRRSVIPTRCPGCYPTEAELRAQEGYDDDEEAFFSNTIDHSLEVDEVNGHRFHLPTREPRRKSTKALNKQLQYRFPFRKRPAAHRAGANKDVVPPWHAEKRANCRPHYAAQHTHAEHKERRRARKTSLASRNAAFYEDPSDIAFAELLIELQSNPPKLVAPKTLARLLAYRDTDASPEEAKRIDTLRDRHTQRAERAARLHERRANYNAPFH